MVYRVYRLRTGEWNWKCECGHKSAWFKPNGFKNPGFLSRDSALDDLASHIARFHVREFKFEKSDIPNSIDDLVQGVNEYDLARKAIRKALQTKIHR